MRRLLSRARFLTLLLPLYCIVASVQVGCGGKIAPADGTGTDPLSAGRHGDGDNGYGCGYGGCDDNDDDDYGGYGYTYNGYP